MDGTLRVTVSEDASVAVLKCAISRKHGTPCSAIELFAKGGDNPLSDTKSLRELSDLDKVLFMLLRLPSDRVALEACYNSGGGAGWHSFHKEGWMTDASLADWRGVTVDIFEMDRVIRLEFDMQRALTSSAAVPFVGELIHLEYFSFITCSSLTGLFSGHHPVMTADFLELLLCISDINGIEGCINLKTLDLTNCSSLTGLFSSHHPMMIADFCGVF